LSHGLSPEARRAGGDRTEELINKWQKKGEPAMKRKIAFFSLSLVFIAFSAAWAADIDGKWVALYTGRDGQPRETTFNFKVEGNKLTGTVTGRRGDYPIIDGKIIGDDVTFTVTINIGGSEVKLNYKGKVAGEEIKFTRAREGSDQSAQEFIAKRVK
jgi:hypothetical protein